MSDPIAIPLYRLADVSDAECLAALALQVFFDTYAQGGIRPSVARYALAELSAESFAKRIAEPSLRVIVAEVDQHRVGFSVLALAAESPVPGCPRAELATLYVSRHFAGRGIGSTLLARAGELVAALTGETGFWLSANARNEGAIAFYRRLGFNELGSFDFELEGERHPNLVFVSPATASALRAAEFSPDQHQQQLLQRIGVAEWAPGAMQALTVGIEVQAPGGCGDPAPTE